MPQLIIAPDKYLTPDETKQLRKICNDHALLAKAKGIQVSVRDALKYKGIIHKLIFPPSNQTWP